MSVNARILLLALVAIGITAILAGNSLFGTRKGRQIRERVVASQEQLLAVARLKAGVWPFLNTLSRMKENGQDTVAFLHERENQVLAEQTQLDLSVDEEERISGDSGYKPRTDERREFSEVIQALLRWMEKTEARVRAEPAKRPIPPMLEWELYQDYEREVGRDMATIEAAEQEELTWLRQHWDRNVKRSLLLTHIVTLACTVLMVALTLFLFLPLRGSLRQLRSVAERVGRGDFAVSLPTMGRDELGLLAQAMNRMAVELHGTLEEKQRLMKAEAEVSEREARRYNAILEETVRARTTELEAANTRLEESLRQLQDTQAQLLFADRLAAVGRLAAGVGHEINNPLSYILSNLRFIQRELDRPEAAGLPEKEELMTAIGDAREGADRVRIIVQELKVLSRPDELTLGPVDLGSVIRGAASIATQELSERARLVLDCQDVPPVQGNGPRLGQVMLNLIVNAAHSIEPGRVEENEVRVVVHMGILDTVIVEVHDTGCGIPPENLERIFEPFFTTKPVGMGTGLGLSVCRTIVVAMGGTLQVVTSEVGRGSIFRITLPTGIAAAASLQGNPS
ncbi:sensor histidine kinase [Hyalangium versicolor]|uniref:sensor histidine kinase n=1 Tax=Hyalangium versicolor TaxID=2861190 RepID=UPI001CC9190A|nr:ATP-binding protein [Hyalangium versicolor]